MHSHPDADAFVRAILRDPTDTTTRLVFADWLEETGEPQNVAWAHFIRLSAELATRELPTHRRMQLQTEVALWAAEINSPITVPAALFIAHHESLRQVFPFPNITARLEDFDIPRVMVEYLPESVARENVVLALSLQGNTLLLAAENPFDYDLMQKLQFILNKDIIPVRVEGEDLRSIIDSSYGTLETESVTEELIEFADVARDTPTEPVSSEPPGRDDEPVIRIVNLMFTEAISRRATGVRLASDNQGIAVTYRVGDEWRYRDTIPNRLWPGIFARLAVMAWIPPPVSDPTKERDDIAGAFRLGCFGRMFEVRVISRREPTGMVIELEFVGIAPSQDRG